MFWSQLNYERISEPLSRRGWGDTAADALVRDPVLFAAGGQNDGFHVIYARLASDRLLLTHERRVITRLLRDHPYSLFLFSDEAQIRWHFVNVKLAPDSDLEYDEKTDRRRLFRRITIGPEERLRTAAERISMLDLESLDGDLPGLSPLAIQKRHDEAFDAEAVSDEFFRQYAGVFERAEKLIRGIDEPDRKRLFAQRLFNRLMFIPFIQKKGWLKFGGHTDYLLSLWKEYLNNASSKSNFYRDRLKLLFFSGLNTPDEVNIIGVSRRGILKSLIGDVPYLNAGLFEEDKDDRDKNIMVPDECMETIIKELFNQFNFTVTESTPLDAEVAVDPEMLGRIFEELVTGRHESGSYYTPKPVVSFMCREALKGYLARVIPMETTEAIQQFAEHHHAENLRYPEAVLEALRRVRVCDPACGSGAYLLGMLHELITLRNCLF